MSQSGTRLRRRAPVVVRSKSKRRALGALFSWLAPSDATAGARRRGPRPLPAASRENSKFRRILSRNEHRLRSSARSMKLSGNPERPSGDAPPQVRGNRVKKSQFHHLLREKSRASSPACNLQSPSRWQRRIRRRRASSIAWLTSFCETRTTTVGCPRSVTWSGVSIEFWAS